LTSTVRELQAIASVDGDALPVAPGPITAKLAAAFTDLRNREIDP
jgi:branched-chain amino acid aminotransferase